MASLEGRHAEAAKQVQPHDTHHWVVLLNSFGGSMAEGADPRKIFGLYDEATAKRAAEVIQASIDRSGEDAWAIPRRIEGLPSGTPLDPLDASLFERLSEA